MKNFGEGKSNGIRVWKGIGLQKSDPEPPRPEKVTLSEKACKQGGRETPQGHFSEDSENFSTEPPTREGFSKNGQKVTLDGKSDPEVVTSPLSWESDGLEIEYMPEGE